MKLNTNIIYLLSLKNEFENSTKFLRSGDIKSDKIEYIFLNYRGYHERED